jgi:hypothetical protein
VHNLVGSTDQVDAAQDRALSLHSESKGISRGQAQMHRAACLVRDGDLAGGIAQAATTLDGLPVSARGRFVLTVAEAVLGAVPVNERDRTDVVDYRASLVEAGRG